MAVSTSEYGHPAGSGISCFPHLFERIELRAVTHCESQMSAMLMLSSEAW